MVDDPVLNILISAKKTQLAFKLINSVKKDKLSKKNIFGDTPLHIAAAEGDTTVVEALLRKDPQLIRELNTKGETALHKAALYKHERTFWYLFHADKSANTNTKMIKMRRNDGSTVLHIAIMANVPKLALDIATVADDLILYRNEVGLTPLHLVVAHADFFGSLHKFGSLKSFFYKLIPLEENSEDMNAIAGRSNNYSISKQIVEDEASYAWIWKYLRSKCQSENNTILDLIELIGRWLQRGVFNILKPVFPALKDLEQEKKRHLAAVQLVECLLHGRDYDFYCKGFDLTIRTLFDEVWGSPSDHGNGPIGMTKQTPPAGADKEQGTEISLKPPPLPPTIAKKEQGSRRWVRPPLIVAAELGLSVIVSTILRVCPKSVIYLDDKGRNVLQVAIQSSHEQVVRVIKEAGMGRNPVLHSFLSTTLDSDTTRNTILHLAAGKSAEEKSKSAAEAEDQPQMYPELKWSETTHELFTEKHKKSPEEKSDEEPEDSLQMQQELKWFEMVENIIPEELRYKRNWEEMTAHELFTENHKKMLQTCKKQLVDNSKTYAGVVAAVVFTSSFSIPSGAHNESGKLAYMIFTHAYALGFGFATTALVLFLSLVVMSYKETYFRLAIPKQYKLAILSFELALTAFLVSFCCNYFIKFTADNS